MSCSELPPLHEIKCKPVEKVKRTYLVKATDVVFMENGFVRIKRKYGKFNREVVEIKHYDKNSHR